MFLMKCLMKSCTSIIFDSVFSLYIIFGHVTNPRYYPRNTGLRQTHLENPREFYACYCMTVHYSFRQKEETSQVHQNNNVGLTWAATAGVR